MSCICYAGSECSSRQDQNQNSHILLLDRELSVHHSPISLHGHGPLGEKHLIL